MTHDREQEEPGEASTSTFGRYREHPWVSTATHQGHELHESGNMKHDTKIKRAEFIDKSVEVRGLINFASPVEILKTLKVYCSSFYGSILWDLAGDGASQVFNAWTTAFKLPKRYKGLPGSAGPVLWPDHCQS